MNQYSYNISFRPIGYDKSINRIVLARSLKEAWSKVSKQYPGCWINCN